jgi:hypothetical protein
MAQVLTAGQTNSMPVSVTDRQMSRHDLIE